MRAIFGALLAIVMTAGTAWSEGIQGEYLEARNADVWTGPCFANGEFNIVGNKATLAWKVTEGTHDGVDLAGRSVVAVVFGDKTFGLGDPVRTRTVLIVDEKANSSEKNALIGMAKRLSGDLIQEVVAVESAPIKLETAVCDGRGCARLSAGLVTIQTRCLHDGDTICGHEDLYYPALSDVVDPYAAYAVEHRFTGDQMGETFAHGNARSAIIARFRIGDADGLASR